MSDNFLFGLLLVSAASMIVWVGTLTIRVTRLEHRKTVVVTVIKTVRETVCTWGASSIGPVTIENGHVTGDTTAHVTGCTR